MTPSKEDFLERKLLCLEKRLTLIERFVEARFSETIQEFSTGTSSPQPQSSYNRPAPASVKRNASEQPAFHPKTFKKSDLDLEGVKDCVVRVVRLSPSSSSTAKKDGGVASRIRRTRKPVVYEDFITDSKFSPPQSGQGELDDDVIGDSDYSEPLSPLPTETHFGENDLGSSEYQDKEEVSYFTLRGTLRPAKSGRGGRVHYKDEDEDKGEDEGDPTDGNWSGAEDFDAADPDFEDDIDKTAKKKSAPRSTRKRGPRPDVRKRLSTSLKSIRKDAIRVADPNMRQCSVCHIHVKQEKIPSHMDSHTKARHILCKFPNCDRSFYTSEALRKHVQYRHHPEIYGQECRICQRFFPQKDKTLRHERGCTKKAAKRGEHVDPSIIEDIQRRTKVEWKWVMPTPSSDSTEAEEKKKCPHCNKLFKAKFFDAHLKNHELGRKWICNLCEKAFFNKKTLVKHIAGMHKKQPEMDHVKTEVLDEETRNSEHSSEPRPEKVADSL